MLDERGLAEFIDTHASRSRFRLETLPAYEVATDGSDFARYLAGEPAPTPERKQPWLDRLRRDTAAGLRAWRVHILTPPLSDYLRYECEWGYAPNAEAGEDIRILDLSESRLPVADLGGDFWVLDDHHVVLMRYDEHGRFVGADVASPSDVPAYRTARDVLWDAGEPFNTWWARHPEYHRQPMRAA